MVQELFPPNMVACVPPFMQFAKKGLNWLQQSILNKLHDHSFSNIIFDMAFDLHHGHLRSCAGPRASVWFFVHLIIPPFYLPFDVFSYILCTRLGIPNPLIFKMTHCICDQRLETIGPTFFIAPMVGNGLHPMMWFKMPSPSLQKMQGFMFKVKRPMSFHSLSL